MKKAFTGLKPIYQIVILDIAGMVLLNWVMSSEILTNSKISLSVIIGVITLGLIITIYHRSFIKEEEKRDERLEDAFEHYYIRLKELADKENEELNAQFKELEAEIAALKAEQTIFPLPLGKKFVIHAINQTGLKPFYDSDWTIYGEYENQLFSGSITRSVDQTKSNLIELVRECSSPEEIFNNLEQYDKIYPNGEENS